MIEKAVRRHTGPMVLGTGRRSGGRANVRVYGCSPGCLLASVLLSVILTVVLNGCVRLF